MIFVLSRNPAEKGTDGEDGTLEMEMEMEMGCFERRDGTII